MSDKVHAGPHAKSSKELFREGFKAFKDALKGAEGALSHSSTLESEAGQLMGDTALTLAELPKILFKLSQSTSVGAVITSPTGGELMANNAFYALTKTSGGAGGAEGSSIKLRKDAESKDEVSPPWMRSTKSGKAAFERLFCGEGDSSHPLDFYCQPLMAANGEFEGAFTLVADSSQEVSAQDKLKEMVEAIEGQLDGLKSASDELMQFLKANGYSDIPVSSVSHAISAAESIESLPDASLKSLLDSSKSNSQYGHSTASTDTADSVLAVVPEPMQESLHKPVHNPVPELIHEPARPPIHESMLDSFNDSSHEKLHDLLGVGEEPADEAATNNSFINSDPADDDSDFDPAQLQKALESASAFILDQESASNAALDDAEEGPEELWQEMSNGLADVLNVEDSEDSKLTDINLTILEEKPRTHHNAPEKGSEPVFKNQAGEPASCLVVDDIPVNQKLLVFQLKHFGMNIDTASSGSEALDLIGKNNYDVVFMDCDMPRMSGYDTTAEIRRREQGGRKLPVIGMTSHDREGDKQKCTRSGMNDSLAKGVSESELRRTIATALGVVEVVKTLDGPDHERSFEPQELEELISTFLYAMEMFVSSMQRAIDEKDSSLVRELASSVSGPSRVLGLHDMNKVSQEMVRLSSSGDWPQVRLKYLKLKTVYMRCQEDLRKLCPQAFSQVSATH